MTKMLKMQKISNLFLLVGRDDQLVYFNHVFTTIYGLFNMISTSQNLWHD